MLKKVSVIIPVYNGEKYLKRCIDSALSQHGFDKDELEILLLNDGSIDSSKTIIDSYAAQYPKIIRKVHQKNCGVATTRNKGIAMSTGEYVIFLDQDDWIDSDYIKTFYQLINKSELDVVYGGYRRPNQDGVIRQSFIPSNTEYGKYIVMAAWAKIHRTGFLKENSITFFSNKIGEDSPFTISELHSSARWKRTDYVGYNWFFNEKSVSNTLQKELTSENILALEKLIKKLILVGGTSTYFQYFLLRTTVHYLLFAGRNTTKENFVECADKMFSIIESYFSEIYNTVTIFPGPKGEVLSVRVAICFMVFLRRTKLLPLFAKFYCRKAT